MLNLVKEQWWCEVVPALSFPHTHFLHSSHHPHTLSLSNVNLIDPADSDNITVSLPASLSL